MEGKNRSLPYREWLKTNAVPIDASALPAARTKRDKRSPDYGAAAEKLSDRGLSRTGYADWLRERNEEEYRQAAAGIREVSAARSKTERNGYLAYLKEWENAQDELMQKTLSDLAANRVAGISEAYADALSAGLSDDRARLVSRVAPALGKYGGRKLRQGIAGVLAVSLSAGLSGVEAELLARALGIDRADAKKLRETVESTPPGSAVSNAGEWERE